MLQRRLAREPLAYIVGHREFYGLDLLVNSHVLIPRPETETLVELALSAAPVMAEPRELVIADVGTGCGAIAVSLACEPADGPRLRPRRFKAGVWKWQPATQKPTTCPTGSSYGWESLGTATGAGGPDRRQPALHPSARIPTLQLEVQREPRVALDGGPDGLDCIRALLAQAPGKLKDRGAILLELDPEQVPVVEEMAREHFPGAMTNVTKDLAGLDRVFSVNRQ